MSLSGLSNEELYKRLNFVGIDVNKAWQVYRDNPQGLQQYYNQALGTKQSQQLQDLRANSHLPEVQQILKHTTDLGSQVYQNPISSLNPEYQDQLRKAVGNTVFGELIGTRRQTSADGINHQAMEQYAIKQKQIQELERQKEQVLQRASELGSRGQKYIQDSMPTLNNQISRLSGELSSANSSLGKLDPRFYQEYLNSQNNIYEQGAAKSQAYRSYIEDPSSDFWSYQAPPPPPPASMFQAPTMQPATVTPGSGTDWAGWGGGNSTPGGPTNFWSGVNNSFKPQPAQSAPVNLAQSQQAAPPPASAPST